jgi:hypothetical protein
MRELPLLENGLGAHEKTAATEREEINHRWTQFDTDETQIKNTQMTND